ncbi:DUF485 domain-containing protein [Aridibaculum aurantiacum]|uniref:DUF485 domain-containing protein n=1 Tax=Aridibaculum aurantiacum TaxID=2810307 RepID=UPI001A979E79|nr:DUF485 domain-containing protein [Aridibaculum aurantiacum]
MRHEPAVVLDEDLAAKRKASLGIRFFFIYLFFYAGFVIIGVFNYELLATEVAGGINLALVYGIGLILFAVILGIIYNFLCSRYEDEMNKEGEA